MPAEHEQRGSPPAHATGSVQFVAVEDIAADESFRLRPDGDVSELATALGRLGQLSPIELRPWPGAAAGGGSPRLPTTAQPAAACEASASAEGARWQVVAGFRRLAAVRMLARERVLARLHGDLGDEDAWGLALGEALLHEPLTGNDLESLRDRLRASGVAPWAEQLLDDALVRAPVAADLRERFYEFLKGGDAPTPSPASTPATPPDTTPTDTATSIPTTIEALTDVATPSETLAAAVIPIEPAEPTAEAVSPEEFIEVTPDELVQDLVGRLAALNQDLATAVEAWKDLPPEGRKSLLDQARYVAALLPFMETQE